ncbi:MAG: hypothetical protein LBK99_12760 [Opitutaceae bacterium]|jgi:hypothetical protein|nr:hypothetical protein [Opitutaceae bacterium]
MQNHTGIIKTHLQHICRGGSLWRALPVFTLAALFGTSTGFAGPSTQSIKSGSFTDSSLWEDYNHPNPTASFRVICRGHTVTLEADQSANPGDYNTFAVTGHFVMGAGSSFSGSNLMIMSETYDDDEWSLARVTLGSGATMNFTGGVMLFGTVEMAAGSRISIAGEATSGLVGWQNLVFDGNGQDDTNAWISAPMLVMGTYTDLGLYDTGLPAEVGPWYNIELNGFGEGTWSLISGISTLVDIATWQEGEGEVATVTLDLSLLNMITLSGDSVANAKAELGFNLDEATGTYTLSVTLSAVPEPAGYATLAGLALLAWVAMRRSRGARR